MQLSFGVRQRQLQSSPEMFSRLLARWRPRVAVTVRPGEMHFSGTDVFVAAPIVWFNGAGQVAAVGESAEASARGYRRVDLMRRGDVLAEAGELGRAAELFLRYALIMAVRRHPLRSWLRPEISYAEDGRFLTDGHTLQRLRIVAFSTLAQRVGVSSIQITGTLAA